jgi:hypothetical protein
MNALRSINPDQMAATLRTLGQVFGAVLGTLGVQYADTWATIGGPVITILLWAWGVWARSDKNLLASAAGVPGVKAVVVPADVARSVPDMKVTSALSMIALLLIGPALLLLPACGKLSPVTSASASIDASVPVAPAPAVKKVDVVIAKVDAGILKASTAVSQFCTEIKLASTGLSVLVTKPGQQRVLDEARAGLDAFCAAPPRDIATALQTLATIYLNVQAVRQETAAL